MNYPSNSRGEARVLRPVDLDEKPTPKVVKGSVIRKKPPLGKRLRSMFFAEVEDDKTLPEYLIGEIMVPALKDLFVDTFNEAVNRKFYGGNSNRSSRRPKPTIFGTTTNHVPYNRMGPSNRPTPSRRSRVGGYDFETIILETRADAVAVINQLRGTIEKYEFATVRELYESIGESFTSVEEKWGWSDLSNAMVRHTAGGYLLELPQPEPIEEQ